jgi:hypothetical protein
MASGVAQIATVTAMMILLTLSGSACTTVMYAGPNRRPTETALLISGKHATIESVDGVPVNGGPLGRYEVLPGQHRVGLAGQKTDTGIFVNTVHRSGRLGTCFFTKPGHEYDVRASLDDGFWTNEVVDDIACAGPPDGTYQGVAAVLPQKPHPGTGVFVGFGGDIGGDDLFRATMSTGETQKLNAGTGGHFTLGATATPLWIRDIAGFGVGARLGFKFDSVDATNGSVQLFSYPLSLWAQSYLSLSERWFLSLASGAHKELGPGLSGKGVASGVQANYASPWGWLIDGGVLFAETWHLALGFSVRYTKMHYSIGGQNIDASNVGGVRTAHFNL